jgi:hypothetical protein
MGGVIAGSIRARRRGGWWVDAWDSCGELRVGGQRTNLAGARGSRRHGLIRENEVPRTG